MTRVTKLRAVTDAENDAVQMETDVAKLIADMRAEDHPAKDIALQLAQMAKSTEASRSEASADLKATEDQIAGLQLLHERQSVKVNRLAELESFLVGAAGQADALAHSTDKKGE